ncbi:hypothetical protein [Thiohalophilus sp.]|uniref:LpxL/LpxP family acyltransferase n=1 Tax=Thiohalophilus sp. TaxID=3028392 RepID=UPI002ACEC81C|nr:hypothetical protein [Thiohalophilus sp.]MDZ7660781.1 hypothetical protein [Thiohalophilus sp.]
MREFLLLLLARLPLVVLHSAGWVSGQLFWLLRAKPARIARRNLDVCLPQLSNTKRRQLARSSLIATARTLLESFRLWHGPADRVIKLVRRVEGEPTRLAHQHQAPVLCAWAERLPRARGFVLHFEPLDNAIAGPDPEQGSAIMNRELERLIRQCPEQYWWSHPRFRHRPEGEPPIY